MNIGELRIVAVKQIYIVVKVQKRIVQMKFSLLVMMMVQMNIVLMKVQMRIIPVRQLERVADRDKKLVLLTFKNTTMVTSMRKIHLIHCPKMSCWAKYGDSFFSLTVSPPKLLGR